MVSPSDLWLVDFGEPYPGEPVAHRPALVLGPPQMFGPDLPFVIVAPTTTSHRRLSLHVEIEPTDTNGLDQISYVQCELLRSVNRKRLVYRLGHVDEATSSAVEAVVRTLLNY